MFAIVPAQASKLFASGPIEKQQLMLPIVRLFGIHFHRLNLRQAFLSITRKEHFVDRQTSAGLTREPCLALVIELIDKRNDGEQHRHRKCNPPPRTRCDQMAHDETRAQDHRNRERAQRAQSNQRRQSNLEASLVED